jgi:hypothetical protein
MIPAPMLLRLRSSIPAVLAVAALAYVVIGYSAGRAVGEGGNPEVFIHAGQAWLAPDLLPEGAYHETSTGYDGQFFFYIAQDLLLDGRAASRDQAQSDHIDDVPYRYQRILLPALGWVLSAGGDPDLLVWALPLINLLAVLAATLVLAKVLVRHGHTPWIALAFALSLGVVVGVVNDLSDPLAAALFVLGVAWWLDERTWPAVAALAACILARELYVLPVAVIAAVELLRRRRGALPWLVPLAVLALWQLYLRVALTGSPTDDVNKPSAVPLRGAVQKAREVLRQDVLGAAHWELACVGVLLAVWLAFAVAGVRPLATLLRDRRPAEATPARMLPLVALASVLLLPFLSLELWRNIPSYSRYAAPAAGMLVLAYALRRTWWSTALLAAIAALTLTNPVVALVPSHQQAMVRPPAPLGPGQERVAAIQGCLRTAGLRSGQVPAEAPSGASAVSVTLGSGRTARVLVFASAADAQRYEAGAERIARARGGSADALQRLDDVVVVAPRAAGAAERAPLARCLGAG